MLNFLKKIVGDSTERAIKQILPLVEEINSLEPEFKALSDQQLGEKSADFKQRLEEGEELDDILPEAFAAVREAARRTIGQRHYDVQLIGGIVLHQGTIAEMKTGEGKTLVATLPLYLNALEGKGCHLVTVNDYLAKVGAGWMGPIYHVLGLSVGFIAHDYSALYDPEYIDPTASLDDDRLVHWRPCTRHEAYEADITYGTNNEFGFDYLRDNMVYSLDQMVQRGHHYAIVDEVDNVLIDEARTPLIISGPSIKSSDQYTRFAKLVPRLHAGRVTPDEVKKGAEPDGDVLIDLKTRSVFLTEQGQKKIEDLLEEIAPGESIYDPQHSDLTHYLENALRAWFVFHRDKDYVVQQGEVLIVDEFTGRLMPGRRWSDGLHQAVEAKEGVAVQREQATYATITFQNYFRMYLKLAGMTGTAATEKEEFGKIYNLDVVVIPTNVPAKRDDMPDQIYRSEDGKFQAVVDEIKKCLSKPEGPQPVLVGTTSVETSERLSDLLKREKIEHQVLNAKQHQHEARVVAQAGRPGTVTIATNMAGRGTDILLGGNAEALAARHLEEGCSRELLLKAAQYLFVNQQQQLRDLQSKNADKLSDNLLTALERLRKEYSRSMRDMNNGIRNEYRSLIRAALRQKGDTARIKQKHAQLVRATLSGDLALAREIVRGIDGLAEEKITELQRLHNDYIIRYLIRSGLENLPARFRQKRFVDQKRELVVAVLRGDLTRARELVGQIDGLDMQKVVELQQRHSDYMAFHNTAYNHNGPLEQYKFVADKLFDRIYASRARLVQHILHGELDQARALVDTTPGLKLEYVIGVQTIQQKCQEDHEQVKRAGGLHVIGTERHEARRIDNQLRGRAGRQGDPGTSRFYLSLEDELMRRFGRMDTVSNVMQRLGVDDEMPIEAGIINKSIESAQKRVEGYNFDMRKHTVEYDDVMNKQREVVYARRHRILEGAARQRPIEELLGRYLDNYDDWMLNEVRTAVLTEAEARESLERLLGTAELDLAALRAASDDDEKLMVLLEPIIAQHQERRWPIHLLVEALGELLDLPADAEQQLLRADRHEIERYVDDRWHKRHASDGDDTRLLIKELLGRYLDNYDDWMLNEVRTAVLTEAEARESLERLLGTAELDLAALRAASDDDEELMVLLEPIIAQHQERRWPIHLLVEALGELLDLPVDAEQQLLRADRHEVERQVYQWWREQNTGDLEEPIKELFDNEFADLVERYLNNYHDWMRQRILEAIEEATNPTTDEVNILQVQQYLKILLPELVADEMIERLDGLSSAQLQRELNSLIVSNRERGHNIELLVGEISSLVPLVPGPQDVMRLELNLAQREQIRDQYIKRYEHYLDNITLDLPSTEREYLINTALEQVRQRLSPLFTPLARFTRQELETLYVEVIDGGLETMREVLCRLNVDAILEMLARILERSFDDWRANIGVKELGNYQRFLMLQTIDQEWQQYLTAMDDLRQGIGLQAVGQRDPLLQYQTEGYRMFGELLDNIDRTVVRNFFQKLPDHWRYLAQAEQAVRAAEQTTRSGEASSPTPGRSSMVARSASARPLRQKIGRNDDCPCGSGKKFKHCHEGREDELIGLLQGRTNGASEQPAGPSISAQLATGAAGTSKPAPAAQRGRAAPPKPQASKPQGNGKGGKSQPQAQRGKGAPAKKK